MAILAKSNTSRTKRNKKLLSNTILKIPQVEMMTRIPCCDVIDKDNAIVVATTDTEIEEPALLSSSSSLINESSLLDDSLNSTTSENDFERDEMVVPTMATEINEQPLPSSSFSLIHDHSDDQSLLEVVDSVNPTTISTI